MPAVLFFFFFYFLIKTKMQLKALVKSSSVYLHGVPVESEKVSFVCR